MHTKILVFIILIVGNASCIIEGFEKKTCHPRRYRKSHQKCSAHTNIDDEQKETGVYNFSTFAHIQAMFDHIDIISKDPDTTATWRKKIPGRETETNDGNILVIEPKNLYFISPWGRIDLPILNAEVREKFLQKFSIFGSLGTIKLARDPAAPLPQLRNRNNKRTDSLAFKTWEALFFNYYKEHACNLTNLLLSDPEPIILAAIKNKFKINSKQSW